MFVLIVYEYLYDKYLFMRGFLRDAIGPNRFVKIYRENAFISNHYTRRGPPRETIVVARVLRVK